MSLPTRIAAAIRAQHFAWGVAILVLLDRIGATDATATAFAGWWAANLLA